MSHEPPPTVVIDLAWQGGARFDGHAGDVPVVVDGARRAGPSPTQALAVGLAGCMGIDVIDIIQKGRFAVDGLRIHLEGDRRAEVPRRFTHIRLHFTVTGKVPPDRVERAIALSRERYCTVWHSLQPDIDLQTSFTILPPTGT
jgi:putative redox protein